MVVISGKTQNIHSLFFGEQASAEQKAVDALRTSLRLRRQAQRMIAAVPVAFKNVADPLGPNNRAVARAIKALREVRQG